MALKSKQAGGDDKLQLPNSIADKAIQGNFDVLATEVVKKIPKSDKDAAHGVPKLNEAGKLNPSILDRAGATTGQVLEWNGSAWVPGTDDGATGSTVSVKEADGAPALTDITTLEVPNGSLSNPVAGTAKLDWVISSDARIPTQDENNALAGTNGVPSDTNRFVTNSDPRNSDSRSPTAHAASHGSAGADPISIAPSQITAAGAATGNVLKWDGGKWAPGTDLNDGTGSSSLTVEESDADPSLTGITKIKVPNGSLINVAAGTALLDYVIASDARVPTQAENDALQGTNGVVSGTNRFVTDSDPRNSDARLPQAHAASHGSAGADPITLAPSQLSQAGAAAGQVLKWSGTAWAPGNDNNDGTGGSHTHTLGEITQSGATTGQVAKWNGSAWAPADDETGGGGTASIFPATDQTVVNITGLTANSAASASANSKAINAAIRTNGSGKKYVMPGGGATYYINGAAAYTSWSSDDGPIRPVSGMIFDLNGCTIRVADNGAPNYEAFHLWNVRGVIITGPGTIRGDRSEVAGATDGHRYEDVTSSSHEWGHGVYIGYSDRVAIRRLNINKCTGDGVTAAFSHARASDPNCPHNGDYSTPSSRIWLEQLTVDRCRRNGISIIGCTQAQVTRCVITNTGNFSDWGYDGSTTTFARNRSNWGGPGWGIDFESDNNGPPNIDCRVHESDISGSESYGIGTDRHFNSTTGYDIYSQGLVISKTKVTSSYSGASLYLDTKGAKVVGCHVEGYMGMIRNVEFLGCYLKHGGSQVFFFDQRDNDADAGSHPRFDGYIVIDSCYLRMDMAGAWFRFFVDSTSVEENRKVVTNSVLVKSAAGMNGAAGLIYLENGRATFKDNQFLANGAALGDTLWYGTTTWSGHDRMWVNNFVDSNLCSGPAAFIGWHSTVGGDAGGSETTSDPTYNSVTVTTTLTAGGDITADGNVYAKTRLITDTIKARINAYINVENEIRFLGGTGGFNATGTVTAPTLGADTINAKTAGGTIGVGNPVQFNAKATFPGGVGELNSDGSVKSGAGEFDNLYHRSAGTINVHHALQVNANLTMANGGQINAGTVNCSSISNSGTTTSSGRINANGGITLATGQTFEAYGRTICRADLTIASGAKLITDGETGTVNSGNLVRRIAIYDTTNINIIGYIPVYSA